MNLWCVPTTPLKNPIAGIASVNAFDVSDERLAFHSFAVGPRAMAYTDTLATLLPTMAADPKGQAMLQALHIQGWIAVTTADLDPIRTLTAQPVAV